MRECSLFGGGVMGFKLTSTQSYPNPNEFNLWLCFNKHTVPQCHDPHMYCNEYLIFNTLPIINAKFP